ncbi:protein O-linked-mannose beta-1,2-N-acetylglucosaminyltransferase 1-like [Oratosquilla oratoria]|uniref:protein O-linked-mannose beta-1,2-N-acetylglucosaminyltransferase 1-like n=1 Tax=Oratosquilla oratoria TaxID=337810 RepID=UPI003F76C808
MLDVEVMSGPSGVHMETDAESYTVTGPGDGDETNLGIYVIVLDQMRGVHLATARLWPHLADLGRLTEFLDEVQPGRIILFMTFGGLEASLADPVHERLSQLGSACAPFLGPGMSWSWAFVKDGKTLAEVLTVPTSATGGPQVHLHTLRPLHPKEEYCVLWPKTSVWEKRRSFCKEFEGYGDLCRCEAPNSLRFEPPEVSSYSPIKDDTPKDRRHAAPNLLEL